MNNFEKPYDENQKNWQKSVQEFSKFFLDNSQDVFSIEQSEFENKEAESRAERLRVRLAELVEKATKRLGYKADRDKLINDAYCHILSLKESGELPPSNLIDNFCAEIVERLEAKSN